MMRQSCSRNQRSRGWKVKHVLQICVLVAVCVWLVYQVKHSHDKKKALEERNTKLSDTVENRSDVLKLGRKDPHGNIVMITTDDTTHNEEDENKEAEEAAEHENKLEDNEEEGRGTGGKEIEENDRERADEEAEGAEGGEEFGDEEMREGRAGDPGSADNQENEGVDGKSQEAREEHYKADDASSAVVRDTQEIDQENENLGTESSEEQKENTEQEELENGGSTNVTEDASKDGEGHDFPVDGESQQDNSTSFMETTVIEREPEVGNLSNSTVALESAGHGEEYSNASSKSSDQMEQQNNLTIFESNDQMEQESNSTETVPDEQVETQSVSGGVNAESVDSTAENATAGMTSAQDQNTLNETSTLREDNSYSENNSTIFEPNDPIEQKSNSMETVTYEQVETQTMPGGVNAETVDSIPESETVNMGGSAQDQNTENETTTLTEDNANSGNIPLEQTEKSDLTGAADGSDESPKTSSSTEETGDPVQGEATSSSSNVAGVTEEERDAQTDLSTLPEIETKSVEGIAAE